MNRLTAILAFGLIGSASAGQVLGPVGVGLESPRTAAVRARQSAPLPEVEKTEPKRDADAGTRAESIEVQVAVLKAYREANPRTESPALPPELRKAVADLNYRRYVLLRSDLKLTSYGKTARVPVDARYAVCATPTGKDASGRFRIRVSIEETVVKDDGTRITRKAMDVAGAVVPQDHLKLCGLHLEDADLVVVVSAREQKPPRTSPDASTPTSLWRRTFR
mgnify:CR=1 FL=1